MLCPQCGAEYDNSFPFCPGCDAKNPYVEQSQPPFGQFPQAPASQWPVHPPVAAKKKSTNGWLIALAAGILALVIVVALVVALAGSGGGAGKGTELGVPIYPGAKFIEEGSVSKTTEGHNSVAAYPLFTDDSVAEVSAWYKEKLAGKPGLKVSGDALRTGNFEYQSGGETKIVIISTRPVSPPTDNRVKTAINIVSVTGSIP